MTATRWFARPILLVKNVDASLRFYIDQLGFASSWRFEDNRETRVAQVERQGCAFILANNLATQNTGHGLIFISLHVEPATHANARAALDALRAELEERGVAVSEGSWGYRLLVVRDLDGNQLLFNYPNENAPESTADQEETA